MITERSKLYVQLQPDDNGLEDLQAVQRELFIDDGGRLVRPSALHLTIIHIGVMQRIIDAMHRDIGTPDDVILQRAQALTDVLQKTLDELRGVQLPLSTISYERFGEHASTYVLTFEGNPRLRQLHATCLTYLQDFISGCGVVNIEKFMRDDDNLRYALSLRPHVALAKSYRGPAAQSMPKQVTFLTMPVVQ